MSLESVKAHFRKWNREQDIMEFETLSATVEQAADTIGVIPILINSQPHPNVYAY